MFVRSKRSNTIKSVPLGFFMSEVFELGIQVSPLKLSDAEIALFNALLFMNPGKFNILVFKFMARMRIRLGKG